MIAHHRDALAFAAEIGAERAQITRGGKHPKLRLVWRGEERSFPISLSPGDGNAHLAMRATIRHELGIVRARRIGTRRNRSFAQRPAGVPLPRLSGTVLPDWHEALAQHPACAAVRLPCAEAGGWRELIAAVVRHGEGAAARAIVEHPEIDRLFADLIRGHGPVRFREVRP